MQTVQKPELRVLQDAHPMISLTRWQTTIEFVAKLYEAPLVCIVQITVPPSSLQSSCEVEVVAHNQSDICPFKTGERWHCVEGSLIAEAVTAKDHLYCNHTKQIPAWQNDMLVERLGINSFFALPLRWPNEDTFGALCILDYAITHYSRNYLELSTQFGALLEADLQLNRQFNQLLNLSTRDDLTGLANRRGFFLQAEKKVRMARIAGEAIAIIFMDVDQLRVINETCGHRIGDHVLEMMGRCVRQRTPGGVLGGRINGDEIALVINGLTQNELTDLCQSLRAELAQACSSELDSLQITVSVFAQLFQPDQITTIDDMVALVEEQQLTATPMMRHANDRS